MGFSSKTGTRSCGSLLLFWFSASSSTILLCWRWRAVCCRCNSMVALLKYSLAVGAEILWRPLRIKLQGSPCAEYGPPSWIALLAPYLRGREQRNPRHWTSVPIWLAVAAVKMGWSIQRGLSPLLMSSPFQPPTLSETLPVSNETFSSRAWHFSSMANSAFNTATLALAIATDEARLPRELAWLESLKP